jgi:branched-chain amino acid transport system ATP-binding protein
MGMLRLEQVNSFYGEAHILFDISFAVKKAEFACLLGRNGVGKTTTLRTIMGLTPARTGRVTLNGEDITHLPPYAIANRGIGFIPENRLIFTNLTVERNLMVGQKGGGPRSWDLHSVYEHFPQLKKFRDRSAENLSGGEQQMLAIARTLMGQPDLILLDEPSQGLAPKIVREIFKIIEQLRNAGVTILLVEQKASMALAVSDTSYVIEKGTIIFRGGSKELKENQGLSKEILGL